MKITDLKLNDIFIIKNMDNTPYKDPSPKVISPVLGKLVVDFLRTKPIEIKWLMKIEDDADFVTSVLDVQSILNAEKLKVELASKAEIILYTKG